MQICTRLTSGESVIQKQIYYQEAEVRLSESPPNGHLTNWHQNRSFEDHS